MSQSRELILEEIERLHSRGISITPQEVHRIRNKFGFSEEQVRQFEEAFSVFDKDADGVITTAELGTVMTALGHRPSLQELESIIQGVDTDQSGTVDFREFMSMMNRLSSDPEAELREVFSVFDINKDGFITPDELYQILTRLGESITKDDALEMIKEADTDHDGKVCFTEFKSILTAK